jgi:regulation of enolase protein 1 (concanavalin A-like superfamily)
MGTQLTKTITSRRELLFGTLSLTGATILIDSAILPSTSDVQRDLVQGDLVPRMKWMNEPASWKVSDGKITVRSRPKTDFWRKTFYGYITDNGHFLHLPVEGDFRFEARVGGQYAALYDQAGLMVRLDAENWVKCGTELVDGKRHASVVFTRDFSDWSTMDDLSNTSPIWWRAVRAKDSLETLCSLDGKTYTSVRQGYFAPSRTAEVGVMCAAPEGNGFECSFEGLRLTFLH